jgi:hypothetical protein
VTFVADLVFKALFAVSDLAGFANLQFQVGWVSFSAVFDAVIFFHVVSFAADFTASFVGAFLAVASTFVAIVANSPVSGRAVGNTFSFNQKFGFEALSTDVSVLVWAFQASAVQAFDATLSVFDVSTGAVGDANFVHVNESRGFAFVAVVVSRAINATVHAFQTGFTLSVESGGANFHALSVQN